MLRSECQNCGAIKGYEEVDRSPTFPNIAKDCLYRFLEQAQQDEIVAEQSFRAAVRALMQSDQRG
ncbi:MAG: hypothetical protein MUF72_20270 [Elainella sp. Prado103]|jgi:hypothetical protein|nr:hypothetical protein [Elainella sp. Prado103]